MTSDQEEAPRRRRGGRAKIFPNRVTLPLTDDMLSSIDEVRQPAEDRVSFIRAAIAREVQRRASSR